MTATALKGKPGFVGERQADDKVVSAAQNETSVRLENLCKSYGAVQVVKDVNVSVAAGQTVTLLGPSGCGKTTTLRCLAGLETPTSGRIHVGGVTVFDHAAGIVVEPEKRQIGMVFQSYAIWPHMTVGGNVSFPLQIKRLPKAEIRDRVANVLELVGLGSLYDRSAAQLSGGQQQRVALARALVFEPRLVLFDEPLSNLDANLRDHMREELQALQARLKFTAIYVTHDQEEALSLSDKVILMKDGAIEQTGSPREVFQSPGTTFAAKFLGYSNILAGNAVVKASNGQPVVRVEVSDDVSLSGYWRSQQPMGRTTRAAVAFRASHVNVAPVEQQTHAEGAASLVGIVQSASFVGACVEYTVAVGDHRIKAEGQIDPWFAQGDAVCLTIKHADCHIFEEAQ